MNKNLFFIALIVLVALATLALSGPQIVHNKDIIFAAAANTSSNSTNNSTTNACTANITCAGKGDTCTQDYNAFNSSSTDCAQGLYCINSTCVTDNMGDKCSTAQDCHPPSNAGQIGVACVNSVCQYAYGLGDTCTNTTDCMSGLYCNSNATSGSICDGLTLGSQCNVTGPYNGAAPWYCGYAMYCGVKVGNGNTVCMATGASGAACGGATNGPCSPWLYCTSGTCQPQYNVAAGGHCNTNKQCVSGTMCVGANATCATVGDSLTSCTADSDCTATGGGVCYCSPYTGKQFCLGLGYISDACTEEKSTLVSCMSSNNCSIETNAENSCCYKNCASDYKKSITCNCSGYKTQYGSCQYSAYCGGFPIWAIIVIIVVAIVLVLGIVLLVFFMMRRRRQYESI